MSYTPELRQPGPLALATKVAALGAAAQHRAEAASMLRATSWTTLPRAAGSHLCLALAG